MKRSIRKSISDLKLIQSQYLLGDDFLEVVTAMLMIKFLSVRADAAVESLILTYMDEGMPRAKAMTFALGTELPHYPSDLQRWTGLAGQPEGEIASAFMRICTGLHRVEALSGLFEMKALEKIHRYATGALRDLIAWVDRSTKERASERSPELFEELLKTALNPRQGSAVATHPILCQLMVSLLDVNADFYIYDPACGVGELLIETMRRAEAAGIGTVLCGQELNEQILRLCRLRLAFKTEDQPILSSGHTLLAPGALKGTELRTYDRIICDVPFIGVIDEHDLRYDKYKRFIVSPEAAPKTRLYLSFIEHVLATMSADGKAVLLVPGSLLYGDDAEAEMRELLIESNVLESAILLPKMWLDKFTSAAVIVLDRARQGGGNENVVFVDATVYDRSRRTLLPTSVIEEVVALAKAAEVAGNAQSLSREELRERSYIIQLYEAETVSHQDEKDSIEDEIATLRESHRTLCDQLAASVKKLKKLVNDHV